MTSTPIHAESVTQQPLPRWQMQNYNLSQTERALRQQFLQALSAPPSINAAQPRPNATQTLNDESIDLAAWSGRAVSTPVHLGILLPLTEAVLAQTEQSASATPSAQTTSVDMPQSTDKQTEDTTHSPQSYSLFDVIDVINPLQHLPIVGSIYRHLTGDQLSAPAALAGGGLYGGLFGLVASAVNVALAEETGLDATAMALDAIAPTKSRHAS